MKISLRRARGFPPLALPENIYRSMEGALRRRKESDGAAAGGPRFLTSNPLSGGPLSAMCNGTLVETQIPGVAVLGAG
jgi:hypothetical protein